jgi:hypothetical protein
MRLLPKELNEPMVVLMALVVVCALMAVTMQVDLIFLCFPMIVVCLLIGLFASHLEQSVG